MQERQTKQKQIIYEALQTLNHPTATEVYGYVRQTQPSVSRATVFRVLGGFAACGRAQELRLAGNEIRYDYNVSAHYHARCGICGRIEDVAIEGQGIEEKGVIANGGFCVEGYTVEFFGKCGKCSGLLKKAEKSSIFIEFF